ncbi:MAG: hypothetical protein HY680_11935, partial [Chloroflexi bacterium]|nr:hypothetical protein [Chloroflexota bacterium]
NYPVEYLTALFNSHMGNQERVAVVMDECAHQKIRVLPPDVNRSDVSFTIDLDEKGEVAIRFGLGSIKHVGAGAMESLVRSRQAKGPFATLDDFCCKADLAAVNRKAMESLVMAGALDSFGPRGDLLASVERLMAVAHLESRTRQSGQSNLFDMLGEGAASPVSAVELLKGEPATDQMINEWEKELLGKPIKGNPLRHVALAEGINAVVYRDELEDYVGQKVQVVGQVALVNPRTTREGKEFVTCGFDLLGGSVEVVAWPSMYEQTRALWTEGTLLQVTGKVQARDEQLSLYANEAQLFELEPEQADIPMSSEPQAPSTGSNTLPLPSGPAPAAAPPVASPPSHATGNQGHANGDPKGPASGDGGSSEAQAEKTAPDYSAALAAASQRMNANAEARGNGHPAPRARTLVIALRDTGNAEDDAYLLKSAMQLLLEYPGPDKVHLDIAWSGRRTRLEMPLVSTSYCAELAERLAALVGEGCAQLAG